MPSFCINCQWNHVDLLYITLVYINQDILYYYRFVLPIQVIGRVNSYTLSLWGHFIRMRQMKHKAHSSNQQLIYIRKLNAARVLFLSLGHWHIVVMITLHNNTLVPEGVDSCQLTILLGLGLFPNSIWELFGLMKAHLRKKNSSGRSMNLII